MNKPAIRVEGLWKEYIIGGQEKGYKTFREAIVDTVTSPFKRFQKLSGQAAEEQRFWALEDINFEVQPGEVVGIIGRNGAGKSTLLKVLSRITEPTKGKIEIRGRVLSLLEVGTGFHPELTGRENTYLNGAILGMSRAEINKKFDEIVDFAGVEKFIDTPVKRYSSGMQVRLAFAVAAHLEPEILIVDEVLAVGDAEFQKKCLEKMDDISHQQGRTVLFVSHNMTSVQSLCYRSILLRQGSLAADSDNVAAVIQSYLGQDQESAFFKARLASGKFQIVSCHLFQDESSNDVIIEVKIFAPEQKKISLDLRLTDSLGNNVGFGSLGTFSNDELIQLEEQENLVQFKFSGSYLADGEYYISLDLTIPDCTFLERVDNCLKLSNFRKLPKNVSRALNQNWGYGSYEIHLQKI